MDGRRQFSALAVALAMMLAAADVVVAQGPAAPGRGFRPGRERWRAMSPADRQRFRSNIERWRQMSPEERRELRMREGLRQERLKRDAEAAMRDSGLQLEAEKRAQFEQRYVEERMRIERALRQELQEKRRRELAPVVEQLKKEFAAGPGSPVPSATAALSPSPAK